MEIYLSKDGKSVGPYSADELREKIKAGEVDADESAWSAEVGSWRRLGQVLERADSAGGRRRGKSGGEVPPPPDAPPPAREKSNKLQRPGSSGGASGGGFDAPVRAMPDGEEKLREAKRLGGASSKRPNPLAFLRWLGVAAFAVYLFSMFLPWVQTSYAGASTELGAVEVLTTGGDEVVLPGTTSPPKYFGAAKTLLGVASIFALFVLLLSVASARNTEAGSSALGVMLGSLSGLGLAGFGLIYGLSFERQFNAALAEANRVLGEGGQIVFTMSSGFYFALAAVVLMVACLMVPQVVRGLLREAMVPAAAVALVACGLGFVAVRKLGADSIGGAADSIGSLLKEGVEAAKGTLDEFKGEGGG